MEQTPAGPGQPWSDPNRFGQPAESGQPEQPVAQGESGQPSNSVQASDSVQASEPVQPNDAAQATDAVQPNEPAQPGGTQPYEPVPPQEFAPAPEYAAAGYAPSAGYAPPAGYIPPVGYASHAWYGQPAEPLQQAPHHRRRLKLAAGALALAAAVAVGFGVSSAIGGGTTVVTGQGLSQSQGDSGQSGQSGETGNGNGNGNTFPGPQAANAMSGTATAAQQVGVVDIVTELKYRGGEAAGTGMILTSNGEVLTNNHVVNGATSIKVTVVSTGATYNATVVGTDPTEDVAVVQLQNASGLQTAKTADSSKVQAGDAVTAVGNAGGVGGTPSAATGSVIATGQSLTASDENGSNAETLNDMIQIDADVQAGDSGGPLYNASDKVIGMDTAASSSNSIGYGGQTAEAYAIPINRALSIADQIESGHETSTIHIGSPAFLGVGLQDSTNGAVVTDVASGTPAEQAGLSAGDVITSLGGKSVDSAEALSTAIAAHNPGDHVTLGWTDQSGQSHSESITLIAGPAD